MVGPVSCYASAGRLVVRKRGFSLGVTGNGLKVPCMVCWLVEDDTYLRQSQGRESTARFSIPGPLQTLSRRTMEIWHMAVEFVDGEWHRGSPRPQLKPHCPAFMP